MLFEVLTKQEEFLSKRNELIVRWNLARQMPTRDEFGLMYQNMI